MKVHKHYLWYKLSGSIRTALSNFNPIHIRGLEESFDQLTFVVTFENKVILHTNVQFYKIIIEIKAAVCELITANNFTLLKQYFDDFLRIKCDRLLASKRKRRKTIELFWSFTLDSIPGVFFE